MSKETYCQRADHELIIRSFNEDIEAALCCKSQNPVSLFEENALEKIKTDLNNGIKNKHCTACWKHESQGIKSWRQIGNEINYRNRRDLELYLDNTCDLACVYCSNKYSSKWQQELNYASEADKDLLLNLINDRNTYNPSANKINHVKRMLDEVVEFGTRCRDAAEGQIMMLGGEPLLAPYIKKNVIYDIVSSYYTTASIDQKLKIVIVTNGNTPDALIDRTITTMNELSQQYEKLEFSIALSMESTGKIAEYIRYGLDWNQFVKNYKKYLATGYQVGVNLTVNAISYYDTSNFIREMFEISRQMKTQVFFQFNTCLYPNFLSIGLLPKEDRYVFDEVRDIIKEYHATDTVYAPHIFLNQMEHNLNLVENFFGKETDKKIISSAALSYFDYIKRERKLDIEQVNNRVYNYIKGLANE